MSYWITLQDENGDALEVGNHTEGGTYAFGGTNEATLNVTYNYCGHFSFKSLRGKTGAESIPLLQEAVARLGVDRDQDYWAATSGNAGYACSILLAWAQEHPEGTWRVN